MKLINKLGEKKGTHYQLKNGGYVAAMAVIWRIK